MKVAKGKTAVPEGRSVAHVERSRRLRYGLNTNRWWVECGVTALVATALLAFVFRLWRTDLRIPFTYSGDGLSMGSLVKTLMDNGWYLFNPALGAPFGRDFHDYPVPEFLHLLVLKLIGVLAPNFAFTANFYFCLTFPLAAGIAFGVLRRYGISFAVALVFSVLFAFLPAHFYRNIHHLFLAAYYTVPLSFLLAMEVARGGDLFGRVPADGEPGLQAWQTAACAIVLAISGLYYAFFSGVFVFVGGLYGSVRRRSWRPVLQAAVVGGLVVLLLACVTAPNILYRVQHGANFTVAKRFPVEAEVYGMRISQLLLPIQDHAIRLFQLIRRQYDEQGLAIPWNENAASSLGVVGALGFLVLLVSLMLSPGRASWTETLRTLGILNLAGVLLATIGGFGSIFAFTITPGIRGYNRISVFLGFLALFAIALTVEAARARIPTTVFYPALGCVMLFGVYDQTPNDMAEKHERGKKLFLSDEGFVRRIENSLPPGSMIFELPMMPWPENGHVGQLEDYDPVRGYLHSKTLRWSYGAMRGRYGDLWIENVSRQPVPELLSTLAFAGYAGIYVELRGYEDNAAALVATLRSELREEPWHSDVDDVVFFDIRKFASELKGQYSEQEWQTAREDLLNPVDVSWGGTCSSLEHSSQGGTWRWCGSRGDLVLEQHGQAARQLVALMNVQLAMPDTGRVELSGAGVRQSWSLGGGSSMAVQVPITAPPGRTVIHLASNGKTLRVPGDARDLVFKITDFRIVPAARTRGPVNIAWNGCSVDRGSEELRSCMNLVEITIANPYREGLDLLLTMSVRTAGARVPRIRLSAPGSETGFEGMADQALIAKRVLLPPGSTTIRMNFDGARTPVQIGDFIADEVRSAHVIPGN